MSEMTSCNPGPLPGDEFPEGASVLDDPSRRTLLKLMGASLGLAGLTACSRPVENILPAAKGVEDQIPGNPLYYATAMSLGGVATGLLVIIYTVTGGSEAVSLTQKWQMGIIFGGMVTAFFILVARLPDGLGFSGAAHIAAITIAHTSRTLIKLFI